MKHIKALILSQHDLLNKKLLPFHRFDYIVHNLPAYIEYDLIILRRIKAYHKNFNKYFFKNFFVPFERIFTNVYVVRTPFVPSPILYFPFKSIVFAIFAFLFSIGKKYDILIADGPMTSLACWLLKKLKRTKIVVYDDNNAYQEFFTRKLERKVVYALENFSWKHADLISTLNKTMKERIKNNDNVIIIKNGCNLKYFYPFTQRKTFTLIYAGALQNDLMIPLEGLAKLNDLDINFLIIGSGNKSALIKRIKELNLQKSVKLLDFIRHEKLGRTMNKCHAGIAMYNPQKHGKYGSSTKVGEYFACGLPAIVSKTPSMNELAEDSRAAIVVSNAQEFALAVRNLYSNKLFYATKRKNALKYSREIDWNIQINKLLSQINEMLKRI